MAYNLDTIWEETESDVELEAFEYLEYWEDRNDNDSDGIENMAMKKWKGIFCLNKEELVKGDGEKEEVEVAEEGEEEEVDKEEVEVPEEDEMDKNNWEEMLCINLEALLEEEQEDEEEEEIDEDEVEVEEEEQVPTIKKKKWWKRLGNLLFSCAMKKKKYKYSK